MRSARPRSAAWCSAGSSSEPPLGDLLLLIDAAAAQARARRPPRRLQHADARHGVAARPRPKPTSSPATRCIRIRGTPCFPNRASSTCRFTSRAPTRTSSPRSAPTPDLRTMTAVHQFVPTLAPRDAVGRHYLAIQETLRDGRLQLRHLFVRGQGRVQAPGPPVHVVRRQREAATDLAALPLLGRLTRRRLRRRPRRAADRRLPQHHARAVLRALGTRARGRC